MGKDGKELSYVRQFVEKEVVINRREAATPFVISALPKIVGLSTDGITGAPQLNFEVIEARNLGLRLQTHFIKVDLTEVLAHLHDLYDANPNHPENIDLGFTQIRGTEYIVRLPSKVIKENHKALTAFLMSIFEQDLSNPIVEVFPPDFYKNLANMVRTSIKKERESLVQEKKQKYVTPFLTVGKIDIPRVVVRKKLDNEIRDELTREIDKFAHLELDNDTYFIVQSVINAVSNPKLLQRYLENLLFASIGLHMVEDRSAGEKVSFTYGDNSEKNHIVIEPPVDGKTAGRIEYQGVDLQSMDLSGLRIHGTLKIGKSIREGISLVTTLQETSIQDFAKLIKGVNPTRAKRPDYIHKAPHDTNAIVHDGDRLIHATDMSVFVSENSTIELYGSIGNIVIEDLPEGITVKVHTHTGDLDIRNSAAKIELNDIDASESTVSIINASHVTVNRLRAKILDLVKTNITAQNVDAGTIRAQISSTGTVHYTNEAQIITLNCPDLVIKRK